MLRSSGSRPITASFSIKLSSSPAESDGTSRSHCSGRPEARSSTLARASMALSSGAKAWLTDSSRGPSRSAAFSGSSSTQALGSNPPSRVASRASRPNTTSCSQAGGVEPCSRVSRLWLPQPRANRARLKPNWVASKARRRCRCRRAIANAAALPRSASSCTRVGRSRIKANSLAAKKATRASSNTRVSNRRESPMNSVDASWRMAEL